MRIRNVSIEGFGPFRHRQFVDFTSFDDDGLFLISGETGAGKSTILDSVIYALYGTTPRWQDASATGVAERLRSDFCDGDEPTLVVLEFEANGALFKVSRSPSWQRARQRGQGTTVQVAKVVLEQFDGRQWVGLASKEAEVKAHLQRLVGLNADEFLQVVLLAQGRFQAFLLAKSDERVELLSKLFGAGRFHDYQGRLNDRRLQLGKTLDAARVNLAAQIAGVKTPSDLPDKPSAGGELAWIDEIVAQATTAAKQTDNDLEAADQAAKQAAADVEVAKWQQLAVDTRARLAQLHQLDPVIAQVSATLARAQRAERVRGLLQANNDASARLNLADNQVVAARAIWSSPVADGQLGGELARLDGEIGKLDEAVQDEQTVAVIAADIIDADQLVQRLGGKLSQTTAAIEALSAERAQLVGDATQVDVRQTNVSELQRRLELAKQASAATSKLMAAREDELDAERAFNQANQGAADLLEVFLRGQAAWLATQLVDGQPCAVCGSPDHPKPATSITEPVSQAALEQAQAQASQLGQVAQGARQLADDLQTQVGQLIAKAGTDDASQLAAQLSTAEVDLAKAQAASQRTCAIDAELTGDDGLLGVQAHCQQGLAQAREDLARLRENSKLLDQRLAKLRSDFPTVKARLEALTSMRGLAKQLLEAIAEFDSANAQANQTHQRLVDAMAQQQFDSADDVAAALLGKDETAQLEDQVAQHNRIVNEAEGVLKMPELNDLPKQQIDLVAAQQCQELAQSSARRALEARADAHLALEEVRRQRQGLRKSVGELAKLEAEYEVVLRLAETVNGRPPNNRSLPLETYFLIAELEEVLASANTHLAVISDGRFSLTRSERGARKANAVAGLELEVMDEYTGKARDPHTLSGGEQFFASLALALGLAEVVSSRAGGVELQTLFVDEGFASLSPQFLDKAMATLDSLRAGGRTVGIISHVESLKETIGAQLVVTRQPGGPSQLVIHRFG